jgi:hypothetical protein
MDVLQAVMENPGTAPGLRVRHMPCALTTCMSVAVTEEDQPIKAVIISDCGMPDTRQEKAEAEQGLAFPQIGN